MRVLILAAISALALPFMAFGQGAEQQQPQQGQQQTKEAETTAPVKGNKMHPAKEQGTPETKAQAPTGVKAQTKVQQGRTEEPRKDAAAGDERPSTSETKTKVNVQEFRSRHAEVFNLGRHPKEFFIQRFGENHVRLIGSAYFVWVDNCWVAVDVDGFGFSERVICAGDPEYIEVY